jgi:PAS domain S-box-containing protein
MIFAAYAVQEGERVNTADLPEIPLAPPGKGTQSQVIHTCQPLIIAANLKDQLKNTVVRIGSEDKDTQSALYVPMLAQDQVLGVIQVTSYSPDRFTKEDIQLLTLVANTAAGTIQNARLYELAQKEITERKRVEERIRRSEGELKKAQSYAHVGSWVWDIKTNRLEWSDQMYVIFGIDQGEFAGILADAMTGAIHPDDRAAVERTNFAVINDKKPIPMEYRVIWPDGTVHVVWAEAGEFILDNAGNPSILSGIVQDITGRKQAEEAVARQAEELRQRNAEIWLQVDRLQGLRTVDEAINGSLDLNLTAEVLLRVVTDKLKVDAADILLLDPHSLTLFYLHGRGFRTTALQPTHLRLGQGLAGWAALERKMVHVPNLRQQKGAIEIAELLRQEQFVEYIGVPLIAKGVVKGMLEVFHRSVLSPDDNWFSFIKNLAGQAAIAIVNIEMLDELQRTNNELTLAYDESIEGWARSLELRDEDTQGHTQRVAEITLRLASASRMKNEELANLRRGALLHDIGELGIPDRILLKPGALTEEEWVVVRKHPEVAYELLSSITFLKQITDIPYCHHEKWDGSGYPRGLKGEQIPLAARLFAVADVWDALCSERPYRPAWTESKAAEYIRQQAGKHFDPQAVNLFFDVYLAEENIAIKPTLLIVDDEENVNRSLACSMRYQFTVVTANSGEEALRLIKQVTPAVVLTDQRMPGMTGMELLERILHVNPRIVGILISGYTDTVSLTTTLNLSNVRGFIPKPWDIATLRDKLEEAVVQYYNVLNGS